MILFPFNLSLSSSRGLYSSLKGTTLVAFLLDFGHSLIHGEDSTTLWTFDL